MENSSGRKTIFCLALCIIYFTKRQLEASEHLTDVRRAPHHLKFDLFWYYKSVTGFCPQYFGSKCFLFGCLVWLLLFFLRVTVWEACT